MANNDTPRGLRPVKYLGGAAYTGAANRYYIPASDSDTAVYIGGLVKMAGSADSNGIPSVSGNITTGDVVVGVVVGFDPDVGAGASGRDSTLYRANSTERYVLVADDPSIVFAVQDDASATLTAGNIGNLADLTGLTSGSTTTGFSSIEISASTATTGAGDEDVLIIGLDRTPDNSIGDNANWLVRLNNHFYIDNSPGV